MSPAAGAGLGLAAGLVLYAASAWLTGRLRRLAPAWGLMDVPNRRSAHRVATPRGGGIAILGAAAGGLLLGAWAAGDDRLALAVGLLVLPVAAIAFLDDLIPLPPATRFLVQAIAAAGVLAVFWPAGGLMVGAWRVVAPWAVAGIGFLWLVWLANLYNFMDGSDGLAGVQAAAGGGVLAAWFAAAGDPALAGLAAGLAVGALAFLPWNWAPARIFMGDTGSVTIGFLVGVLGILGALRQDLPLDAPALAFSLFIGDASLTLLRRLLRGETPWRAHRSHCYQRALRLGYTHAQIAWAAVFLCLLLAGLATLRLYVPALWWACWAAAAVILGGAAAWLEWRLRAAGGAAPAARGQ